MLSCQSKICLYMEDGSAKQKSLGPFFCPTNTQMTMAMMIRSSKPKMIPSMMARVVGSIPYRRRLKRRLGVTGEGVVTLSEKCMNREREMFYLTTHSTHFIYGYMASDIWLRTILIVRKETCCRHIGYSYRLTARVLLYAPSHRQDNTYHGLCYTSRGALAGNGNSSIGCMNRAVNILL